MNILILILLFFFILGLADKAIGGRLGLSGGLERGLSQMGALAMSMAGFYCIGVTFIRNHLEAIVQAASEIPFDLSMLPGLLLAPDMGGFPMAVELANEPALGLFSGILLSSSIGCLLSFQLPVALNMIRVSDIPVMMRGIIPGLLTMPVGLFIGGIAMGLPISVLLFQMIPVLVFCAVLALVFWKFPAFMEKALSVFGQLIRALGLLLFLLVVAGLFYTPFKIADDALVLEALTVVLKITVIVCGALTFSDLLMRFARPLIGKCAGKLGINETSVIGLFICLTSGVAMLPAYEHMDERGKLLNSAFCVMGAYVLGGQMGFIASVADGKNVFIYIVCKLFAGICAVAGAWWITRRPCREDENNG